MLHSLVSMVDDSIFITNESRATNLDWLPKEKTPFLFISSEYASAMKGKPEQDMAVFVLEEDRNKVDHRARFDKSDDLIFQLADELDRCYKQEMQKHLRAGNIVTAKYQDI